MLTSLKALLRDVGLALITWRDVGGTEGEWKGSQFHAQADRWAHRQLCEGLRQIADFPIVSEEAPPPEWLANLSLYWIIDPIDGTASYSQGFDGFVTQAALMRHGYPIISVVFAPRLDLLFTAERGNGAYCNNVRLPNIFSNTQTLTLIDNTPTPQGLAATLYREFGFTSYIESGSLGLKICRVAEGCASTFYKTVLIRDWDIAPPQLILEEAGGHLSDVHGKKIVYGQSSLSHQGIIATHNAELAAKVASWHTNLPKEKFL